MVILFQASGKGSGQGDLEFDRDPQRVGGRGCQRCLLLSASPFTLRLVLLMLSLLRQEAAPASSWMMAMHVAHLGLFSPPLSVSFVDFRSPQT